MFEYKDKKLKHEKSIKISTSFASAIAVFVLLLLIVLYAIWNNKDNLLNKTIDTIPQITTSDSHK